MEITQSFLNQLSLQDKAAIVCGHHFWFTHENLKYGIKKSDDDGWPFRTPQAIEQRGCVRH